ncbi:Methyl-accepting chemotaxis protein I (serine chemoreceptor protein) [Candidatus Paraburkholderia calva]|nr:Methyl-accepting chemotaxis protein I (serine chemoreceptor protein) [Candidatus Paraburkholderia calva]
MRFADFKIGMRLGLSFAAMLLLSALMVGVGITMLGRLNDQVTFVNDMNLPRLLHADAARENLNKVAIAIRNLLLSEDQEIQKSSLLVIKSSRDDLSKEVDFLSKTLARPEVRDRLLEQNNAYKYGLDKILNLNAQGQHGEAIQSLNKELLPVLVAYKATLDDINQFQVSQTGKATQTISDLYQSSRLLLAGLGCIALILGVALAWLITRSITGPISEAVVIARTIAAGDLTQQVLAQGKDETSQLLLALQDMNNSLCSIVRDVRQGSDTIATATSEIAAGNTDLSSRTEEQAASLQETAASMEQLTVTVRQNAESAKQGNELASDASKVAVLSGEVVGRVVSTMREISDSSGRVADIIGTIEGIAFQTNILALNAAVEAARVGEQGRGFAVVAGEVRVLAQRSATAAKEIKELIDDSVVRVQAGTTQVNEAGRTIEEVVSAVRRVSSLMTEIAVASHEQQQGIEQVNQAVTQMDEVTQQNVALVEQAAAAAGALHDQTQRLVERVSVFRVN